MTTDQAYQFLATFAHTGRVIESCRAAGLEPREVKTAVKTDPEFAFKYAEAEIEFAESHQRAAVTRGRDGWDEPVFGSLGQGAGTGIVGHRRVYSDPLLMLMLKKLDPSFRERMTVDANLTGGVLVVGPVSKTAEEWKAEVDRGDEKNES